MNNTSLKQIVQVLAKKPPKNETELLKIIRKEAGKFKMPSPPKSALIKSYNQLLKEKKLNANPTLQRLLIKRAVRTLSGVSVITVLTKPYPCPGYCVYCPTEHGMPKSYLANEPAAQRAARLKFDPIKMIQKRIEALEANGHQVDKIELLVLGGSWPAYPKKYQNDFIKKCFYATNVYGKKTKRKIKTLAQEQKINETAKYKIIGLTLEMRPDQVTEEEIKHLRELGCTRVQLGIQHTDEKILKLIKRGHGLAESIKATEMLKRTGFKIDHHYMLDLPGSTPAKDLMMFKYAFTKPDLQPDQIKIYPCVVSKSSILYRWYKSGKYKPYSPSQLIQVLSMIKKTVPPYVRINRLIRDIPAESIVAGNKITNLRQYLKKISQNDGWDCQCIHCREVKNKNIENLSAKGGSASGGKFQTQKLKIKIIKYKASEGTEHFLSFESKDGKTLYGFLRLRFNDNAKTNIFPELRGASLVRELHIYGQMVPAGSKNNLKGNIQHQGLGTKLMNQAEKMSKEAGFKKIAVISGVGVRNYYRKLGYQLKDTYMIKIFDSANKKKART